MEIYPYAWQIGRLGSSIPTLENKEGSNGRRRRTEAGMRDKNMESSHPSKRDLTVTCSAYYRCRADTHRALKGHPPKVEQQTDNGMKGKEARMATLATW